MELFMSGINFKFDKEQISTSISALLHSEHFSHLSQSPVNYHLYLHRDKKRGIHFHGGTGALTLPSVNIGNHFLQLSGSATSPYPVILGGRTINFSISKKNPGGLPGIVEQITLRAYQPPQVVAERERRTQELAKGHINITAIQFGWECRDYIFSIECEVPCIEPGSISFGEERREVRFQVMIASQKYSAAINFSQINFIYVNQHLDEPAIVFSLNAPPSYEVGSDPDSIVGQPNRFNAATPRKRLSFLPIPDHERVVPYVSHAIRLVVTSVHDLQHFLHLSEVAQIHRISTDEYPIDRRHLFSSELMEQLEAYRSRLPFSVNFQIESIIRSLVVDMLEMVEIMPSIIDMYQRKGETFTATALRKFAVDVKQLYNEGQDDYDGPEGVEECLKDCEAGLTKSSSPGVLKPSEGDLFDAYHVFITPTTMHLEGPFPERSNRVIRSFDREHHESFLRVSFVDEGKSIYRFDREIDGPGFIRQRFGPFLLDGLQFANEHFFFLGYSLSALKEHTTWFVKPFTCRRRGEITADSIVRSLGTFDDALLRCPARYAARISQAFTATECVEIELEDLRVIVVDDICTLDGNYLFTDGCGTISEELAQSIWKELHKGRKKARSKHSAPKAFQVRFRGSKGMLRVDHKLHGLTLCLPHSMIKFEATEWSHIEIARSFDRPGICYLNRPLIMLLEGLGVPFRVFKHYQDKTVTETRESAKVLGLLAPLLEQYGLGSSFRLPSVMYNLDKLGIDTLSDDQFYARSVDYAVNHILRELKNHARIPIPGAWTLVGVADIHGYLGSNQIFACVKPIGGKTIYLEGPVLISRSPVIHPGDVMVVEAIGRPKPGSPFAAEPLPNTVVFSTQGDRPVPSCLGGGDLDGDLYNLIPLNDIPDFMPTRGNQLPADYTPAPRKTIDHPSELADVANFFMDYISSDVCEVVEQCLGLPLTLFVGDGVQVLGVIATNWLLAADISTMGIFDPDCQVLAQLHSDAVDYPKSGQPVLQTKIPKPKSKIKPDWKAPETINDSNRGDYYESTRAIGRLYRAIDLPIEDLQVQHRSRRRKTGRKVKSERAEDGLTQRLSKMKLNIDALRSDNLVFAVVEERVQEYIDTDSTFLQSEQIDTITQLYNRYKSDLRGHCAANTLSNSRYAQLSEEEALMGTIIQKTSVPRRRKDAMTRLRESTDFLVKAVREQLEGDDSTDYYLERAWIAWTLSVSRRNASGEFGAASFGWIALGAVFDAIGQIEKQF